LVGILDNRATAGGERQGRPKKKRTWPETSDTSTLSSGLMTPRKNVVKCKRGWGGGPEGSPRGGIENCIQGKKKKDQLTWLAPKEIGAHGGGSELTRNVEKKEEKSSGWGGGSTSKKKRLGVRAAKLPIRMARLGGQEPKKKKRALKGSLARGNRDQLHIGGEDHHYFSRQRHRMRSASKGEGKSRPGVGGGGILERSQKKQLNPSTKRRVKMAGKNRNLKKKSNEQNVNFVCLKG